MANATRNDDNNFEGVRFIHKGDGSTIAHDIKTNLVHGDDTQAEAPSQPAEVLILHEDDGEPIADDGLEKFNFDSDEFESHELSDFIQQMIWKTFLNRKVTKALMKYGYAPKFHHGSHARLRYGHPEAGEARNVDVPQHDKPKTGTLRSIAD